MTFLRTLTLTASLAGSLLAPASGLAQKPYRILTQWTIGGEGGWDEDHRGVGAGLFDGGHDGGEHRQHYHHFNTASKRYDSRLDAGTQL